MITCTDAKTGLPITFGVAYIIMVESQADDTRAKVSLAWGAGIITHLVLESHDDVVAKIDALHTVVALDAEQEVGQRDGADRPLASDNYNPEVYGQIEVTPPDAPLTDEIADALLRLACQDCNPNIVVHWHREKAGTSEEWSCTVAHDDGCPTLRKYEEGQ